MQEILILRYCDACFGDKGEKVEAKPASDELTLNGEEGKFDLCPPCDERLLQPLRELSQLRARAQRAVAAEGSDDHEGRAQCLLCKRWIGVRNRVKHTHESHGVPPWKVSWAFPPSVAQMWVCTCGLTFASQRGRNAHARKDAGEEHKVPEQDVPHTPLRAS